MEEKVNNKQPFFSFIWKCLKTAGRWFLDFFRKNTMLKIVSLLFAVFIWAFVIVEENPQRTMTVKDVPVVFSGVDTLTSKNLTVDITDITSKVDVTILAGQDAHKNINTNNVRAYIDFSVINEAGTYTLDIQSSVGVSGASVSRISKQNVTVNVEALATRRIPVSYSIVGEAEEGYYISEPELNSNVVSIRGDKKSLEAITHAVAEISVTGITEETVRSYELILLDDKDQEVRFSSINGDIPSVIATIRVSPIKEVALNKELVKQHIIGIKEGYEITDIHETPSTFQIIGKEDRLSRIESLDIRALHVEDLSTSTLITAELQVPDGITVLSGNTISMYVQISEISSTKTFENVEISYINMDSTLHISIEERYTDVTIVGGINTLDKLGREDIKLYVDLADLSAGMVTLPVRIEEIVGIDVTQAVIEHPTVSVVLG